MNTASIRNLHKLDNFDIVEIVDKKRNQIKGFYLDKKYHYVVEKLYQEKEKKKSKELVEFEKISKNITILKDKTINLTKADEEMYSEIEIEILN